MYLMLRWFDQNQRELLRNLVKLWREYGGDRVTIGKKA
jgi:hypothetical protein